MKYRFDIDCLRGLSVLAVVLYHLQFKFIPGGYLGVDIFFVISGYLITSLILKEKKKKSFSLTSFYCRRIKRLFPALAIVLIATFLLFNQIYLKDEIINLNKSIISSILFYANFYFLNFGSYFNPINEAQPILHTWSLAIEEQFYLFYPFLILFFFKNKKNLFIITFFFTLISFSLSQFGGNLRFNYPFVEKNFSFFSIPQFAFYSTFTRVWEILLGCLAAIYISDAYKQKSNKYYSFIGYVLILGSIIFFNKNTLHPSIFTLIPISGVLLIIFFNSENFSSNGIFKLINNWLFHKLGLISYSLYLWHQPIYQFIKKIYLNELIFLDKILIILFFILIAYLSYRFIEKPFRDKNSFKDKKIFIIYFIVTILILFLSLNSIFLKNYEKKYSKRVFEIQKISNYYDKDLFICSANANKYIPPKDACIIGKKDNSKLALIGDSHLDLISIELGKVFNEKKISALQYSYGGCVPSLELKVFGDNRYICDKYFKEVVEDLKIRKKTNKILLFARWRFHLTGERFNNQEGGKEIGKSHYHVPLNEKSFIEQKSREKIILTKIELFINEISKLDKKIFVVLPTPEMGWEIPNNLARILHLKNKIDKNTLSISKNLFIKENKQVYDFFDNMKKKYDIKLIDPNKVFCNSTRCISHINEIPLYFDDDHLSKFGSKVLSEYILSKL